MTAGQLLARAIPPRLCPFGGANALSLPAPPSFHGCRRGNEETVAVGDVALVNPTPREVLAVVAEEAPDQLPEGYEPPQVGFVERTLTRLLGG